MLNKCIEIECTFKKEMKYCYYDMKYRNGIGVYYIF
jgi:hypothetical protein